MNIQAKKLYHLYFEMPYTISKFTKVNADATTEEYTEHSESMRHFVVKSVLELVELVLETDENKILEKVGNILKRKVD